MTSPQRFYRTLEPGALAPLFSLPVHTGGEIGLVDHLGKRHVWLFFYWRDFVRAPTLEGVSWKTAVSLLALSADAPHFAGMQTAILGISRDETESHAKLADVLNVEIPLLSDRAGAVGESYGLLPENRWAGSSDAYDFSGCAVLIDKDGKLRHWQSIDFIMSPNSSIPDALQRKLESDLRLRLDEPTVLATTELLRIAEGCNR